MPTVTGTSLAEAAFGILNVFLPGEAIPGPDGEFALATLNRMLNQWRTRRLLVPLVARERFDLTVGKGSPTNPYTIGSGGDFDTERPATQAAIVSAALVLAASSPEVRTPLGIYTTDAYNAQPLPTLTGIPTGLYYNPTYGSGFGSIFLWPVPDAADNDLELFLRKPIAAFADLSTEYQIPDGADDAVVYQLAKRLAGPYGKTMTQSDLQLAAESYSAYKRANMQLSDLANDAWTSPAIFNITTGA